MGQEIAGTSFTPQEVAEFERRLRQETELLASWFSDGGFDVAEPMLGIELEAWLIGNVDGLPAAINQEVLSRLRHPLVVPELARFNIELNVSPQPLGGRPFTRLAQEMREIWAQCRQAAAPFGASPVTIGILPSARQSDFSLRNMTPLRRYLAINDQVLGLRQGRPIRLDIGGRDRLQLEHQDVMLEAATTSFQIHVQVDPYQAGHWYNLAKMLSAPMVGLSANSPYLFGRDLWDETRIPLFEQAVAVGASALTKRVSFGIRYAKDSILECFLANLQRYPVLLPQLFDEPPERLAHLRLHNGTIWRWNRPLIGFSATGRPHIRLEHRVVPSGPTLTDCVANAAIFCGSMRALAADPILLERRLPFERARSNFYAAAREGLEADIHWVDGRRGSLRALILHLLLPLAEQGLSLWGVDDEERRYWLNIVRDRVRSGQTGAIWQRAFVEKHGADMQDLTLAYLERQQQDNPVHQWSLA